MNLEDLIFKSRKKLGRIPLFIASNILGPFFWRNGVVFLSSYQGIGSIGEMAQQFDNSVKMGILGWGPSSKGIYLIREEKIVNHCFLNYWRQYIHVISHPFLFYFLYPIALFIQYSTTLIKMPDGEVLPINDAHNTVQKKWEDEGRPPLLSLSGSDYERGWDCLERLGIPRGAWFVCIHARESGFFHQGNDDPYSVRRNVDINTYLPAVETIVDAGGWVIRMGDFTMKPLPALYHVIDYAHSDVKTDWMDIFCCAECRFFLGTTSGLFLVSFVFGVPCALTNYIPMGSKPRSMKDIFITKLYWSMTEERYLTFKEALTSPLCLTDQDGIFKSFNIKIVDNTAEEINDMVLEMLERLKGNQIYTDEDENLQEKYIKLLPHNNVMGGSRIGRAFLRKYERLLPRNGV